MLRVKPFNAIRPTPQHAVRVASVPYDVVSTDEARALAEGNPDSFLHVIRPEIDLPEATDPYADVVYDTARTNLDAMMQRGVMERDGRPRMFLYRQVMDHRPQVGIVCCCHIDDYLNDVILKHEHTRQVKEDDRTRHVLTLNANAGPVFLTYRDRAEIDRLVDRDMNERPVCHFNAPDGVTHTVWEVDATDEYVAAFGGVPQAYVADGHHRSASAARAGAERAQGNPDHTGDEEYNWFLTVLFPASQLEILAYNRIVRDLNGQSAVQFLDRLRDVGTLTSTTDTVPQRAGTFRVYVAGRWYDLQLDPASIDTSDPVGSLDVSLLQDRILTPILGIGDVRTDPRIDFVGGIRGTDELERRVDSEAAAMAVSMYPTSIDQLMDVSDAGLIMPPKSTWFEPKLRSGLFVHSLD